MRRHAARVLLLLALGAIANVAVTWGIVLWGPPPAGARAMRWLGATDAHWRRPVPTGFPPVPSYGSTGGDALNTVVIRFASASNSDTSPIGRTIRSSYFQSVFEIGYPFRALSWTENRSIGGQAVRTREHGGSLGPPPRWLGRQAGNRRIPLRPVWPGFLLNTLVYAAAIALGLAMLAALRRWWRKRRGVCHACGYPVGASNVCTECGAAIPDRAGARRPSAGT